MYAAVEPRAQELKAEGVGFLVAKTFGSTGSLAQVAATWELHE